jgi:hypothetical protein
MNGLWVINGQMSFYEMYIESILHGQHFFVGRIIPFQQTDIYRNSEAWLRYGRLQDEKEMKMKGTD